MLFNSLLFVPFIAIVFLAAMTLGQRARVLALIALSYVFYSIPYPPWLLLLIAVTVADFHLARWIDRSENPAMRRLAVVVSCALNLGLLAAYKYAGFLAETVNGVADAPVLPVYQPDLPLGISFFVFESLSYTVDVYRRQLKPAKSLADYALFISFFPHLIAGPIVRGRDFLAQIEKHAPFERRNTVSGMELIAVGFFKKLVVADNLAPHVDFAFANTWRLSGGALALAVVFFAIQIYCDFSGYTDIARGIARMLGFELGRNFRWPYLSQSISDFWRRWHISLSSWLRDYLYIPLGGNRHGVPVMLGAMLATWFLGGLWHGAAWHFVVWGLYHGALVGLGAVLYRATAGRAWDPLPAVVKVAITFVLVCIGWVLFRSNSVPTAMLMLGKIFTWSPGDVSGEYFIGPGAYLAVASLAVLHYASWVAYRGDEDGSVLHERSYVLRVGVLALMTVAIVAFAGASQTFIYFQF
jgi:D-alanyl-lipoteichoic acid acyltransferase DltB (MBOAT superfamily)